MKKLLIIGAMESEIAGIVARLGGAQGQKAGAFRVTTGRLGNAQAVVCRCGIGKVHAGSATAAVLTAMPDVDLVLNLGVAGGVGAGLRQGDIVVASRAVQHDYDQTPDGMPLGQIPGFDSAYFDCDAGAVALMGQVLAEKGITAHVGTIASGDQFINASAKAAAIAQGFQALACDMETAAVAQVCALFGTPFLGMRAISDGGGDSAIQDFYSFVQKAAARSAMAVCAFADAL